jgi:hypothetical protein
LKFFVADFHEGVIGIFQMLHFGSPELGVCVCSGGLKGLFLKIALLYVTAHILPQDLLGLLIVPQAPETDRQNNGGGKRGAGSETGVPGEKAKHPCGGGLGLRGGNPRGQVVPDLGSGLQFLEMMLHKEVRLLEALELLEAGQATLEVAFHLAKSGPLQLTIEICGQFFRAAFAIHL